MSDIFWTRTTPAVSPSSDAYIPVRVQGSAPDGSADTFAQIALPEALGGVQPGDLGALRATSAYAFPTGSVKKEALFAALDAAGHLTDLLTNLPAVYSADGSLNEAGQQLQFGITLLATDPGAQLIRTRYYAGDDAGFAALFAAAGSGSTTPGTITTAPVVQQPGTSPTQVMSQATVTAELEAKIDLAPLAPLSPIQTGYASLLASYLGIWWDSTNHRFVYVNGGGQYFAQPSTTDHSTWIMAFAFGGVLFEPWRLAVASQDAPTAAKYGAMIEAQWSNWKTLYTDSDFRTGGVGAAIPMVTTSDDAVGLLRWYRQLGDYYRTTYGATNADYLKVCGYILELLPYCTARFRCSIRPNDFNYQISTPALGTAFKSGQYGMLYAAEGSSGVAYYGYGSSPFDAESACVALWLAAQPGTSTPWRTALRAYAVNTEAWIAAKALTPAPTDTSRSPQGLCYANLVLDPNVNANNDPTINGGAAQSGVYDPNQRYLTGQNSYFGKGVRDLDATWEAATQMYACLCADLYTLTGTQSYRAKATTTINAYADQAGYGRTSRFGLTYTTITRDPHSVGGKFADFIRAGIALGVLTPSHPLTRQVFNTARKLIVSTVNGLPGVNWGPAEYNFIEKTWTWEDSRGYQGLGGQTQRNYMMMGAHGLTLIGSTQLFPAGTELAVGSGIDTVLAYAQLPSMLGAVMDTLQEVMTKEGGQFVNRVSFGDNAFYFDFNNAGNPFINWSTGKATGYLRGANKLSILGGQGVNAATVEDGGAAVFRGSVTPQGNP
jgi:hypothetical protein